MTTTPLKSCQGNMSTGFKSLQRANRQAFLAAHPNPVVPTYSIVAKSDENNTSKALMQTWRILSTFSVGEDGQLLKDDAIVPGATSLGAALADHFAIALPFDKSPIRPSAPTWTRAACIPRAALQSLRFAT